MGAPSMLTPRLAPTKAAAQPGPACRGFQLDAWQAARYLRSPGTPAHVAAQRREESHGMWTEAGAGGSSCPEMSLFHPQALQLTASSHPCRCGTLCRTLGNNSGITLRAH